MTCSERPDVGRVDVDADRLADEINGEHEPRLVVLPHQPAGHALQRSVYDFDESAFLNQGTGIECEAGLHQQANALDLALRDRRRLATLERDDADDARAREYPQAIVRV